MVFDGVVSAAVEVFGDFCPAVSEGLVREEQKPLLVIAPVLLLDVWIQMVVPALAALLADSTCILR
jgi:hypothetical protein